MSKYAIFYGSTTGNTHAAAKQLASLLNADLYNVAHASSENFADYDTLIFGTSTWGFGDLQDDWEEFISELKKADLKGKTVALFALGDSEGYPDTFVDGMGTIYSAIKEKGCQIVGTVDTEGYTYDASTAEIDGQFIGLPLDDDNENDKTEDRIKQWVELIK